MMLTGLLKIHLPVGIFPVACVYGNHKKSRLMKMKVRLLKVHYTKFIYWSKYKCTDAWFISRVC